MLALHIRSYKTERDNNMLAINAGADDVYRNTTVEETIKRTLEFYGKTEADILSIVGSTAYGLSAGADVGSWDFWLFVRGDTP